MQLDCDYSFLKKNDDSKLMIFVLLTGVVKAPLKGLTYFFVVLLLSFSLDVNLSTKTVIGLLGKHE